MLHGAAVLARAGADAALERVDACCHTTAIARNEAATRNATGGPSTRAGSEGYGQVSKGCNARALPVGR